MDENAFDEVVGAEWAWKERRGGKGETSSRWLTGDRECRKCGKKWRASEVSACWLLVSFDSSEFAVILEPQYQWV